LFHLSIGSNIDTDVACYSWRVLNSNWTINKKMFF